VGTDDGMASLWSTSLKPTCHVRKTKTPRRNRGAACRDTERFPAKWIPVRVKKTRQNKGLIVNP
jgi:hypothetical protein